MMEGVAMLRQLIGQLHEFLELHGSVPPAIPSNYFIQFLAQQQQPPASHQQSLRWCYYFNLEDGSLHDSCFDVIMTATESENVKRLGPGKAPARKKARSNRSRGKSTPSMAMENMDVQIWKDFPEDLFEAVIARLPIQAFFRLRSVCRKWNSLLASPSFSQQCARIKRAHLPWFYTVTHEDVRTGGGAIYDPVSRKWRRPQGGPSLRTKPVVLPVASACGLVCLIDLGHEIFHVCNPLTGSLRELPARPVRVWSRVAVGMAPHGESGYKVVWVGCRGEYEVYDSAMGSWVRRGMVPPGVRIPLRLNLRSPAACVDGAIYFLRSEPDGLVMYDVGSGAWEQVVVPLPPCSGDHAVAEVGGRIVLVGLVTKNAATCVCVWELQRMTLLWKEVDRMPNAWCLEFYGKHVRMSCLGNKGLIMLSLRSRQVNRLLTYDLCTREWLRVHGKRIACGTAFHPCLTASA